MLDKLYAILNFTAVPIGGTATLPHGLVVNGRPLIPDRVDLQFPTAFAFVSGDATNVTIRNVSSGAGNCQAWVGEIHPVERSFGVAPDDGSFTLGLVPRPFSQGPEPGAPFPPALVVTTIYARLTGNDTTGTGTLLNPYRTQQRAFQDLPGLNPLPIGHRVVVDVTGTGTEAYPATGYQFPVVQGPAQLETFGDPTTVPFLSSEAVTVLATPQPASNIPLADTTVLATAIVSIIDNASTGMATVTINPARASWAANALKGKMCIGSGTDASTSCVIHASDSTHLFLCNTAAAVTSTPQQDLFIVEPSAVIAAAGVGADGAGFECVGCNSIAFQGIGFTAVGGPALAISNAPQPFFELCDIDGMGGFQCLQQVGLFSSVVRTLVDMEASSLTPRRSLLLGVATFDCNGAGGNVFRQTVMDTCAPVGPTPFAAANGGLAANAWEFFDCLFRDSTGDAILARAGGSWSLETVQINTSVGDAIHATGLTTGVLTNVTGTGNGGAGIHLEDGASFRVTDNATLVTGTGGDTLVGTLPARTWTDFRGNIPTKNQYDLQTPFITNVASGLATPGGDDVGGAGSGGCSGSRLFQRP